MYDNLDPVLVAALKAAGAPPITSGYRSPEHNRRVGGAPKSMHVQGKAADIDMSGMSEQQRAALVEALRAQGVTRFGTYSSSPNMLHVDLSDANGAFWQMHDSTNRNMAQAPAWFRGIGGAPAPDVRMASNDMTQPVPTGDPVTGRMDMPQGSLPPEMGGGPSVLTGDLLKQALIQAAQPVKPSPYAAMGATLGAMGDLFALPQYRTGALQRLQEMTSPGYQQAMAQKDQAQQLYWTQLALQLNRDLGGVKMSPLEQQRAAIDWARLQQDQAELQARKEGAYNTGEPPTPRLVNVFDQGGTFLGQKSVLPGETPDPGTSWGNMGQGFQGTPPAKAEEANPYAGQLEQLESLIGDLEQNPAMQNALGTSGSLGAKISAVAGLFDQVFGTQVNTGFKAAFGGEDPAIVQGRLRGVVLPVARLLVEPKGPLSRDEQAQARLLLGVMEDGKLLSADQAFRLLKLTNKAVRKAAGLPVEDGGSTGSLPPQVDEVLPTTPGAREIQTEDGRTFRIYQ
jgi:hypothetical protein